MQYCLSIAEFNTLILDVKQHLGTEYLHTCALRTSEFSHLLVKQLSKPNWQISNRRFFKKYHKIKKSSLIFKSSAKFDLQKSDQICKC